MGGLAYFGPHLDWEKIVKVDYFLFELIEIFLGPFSSITFVIMHLEKFKHFCLYSKAANLEKKVVGERQEIAPSLIVNATEELTGFG